MTKDLLAIETKGEKMVEVLIGDEVKMWIPVMATLIYIIDRNGNLNMVQEIRVRDLSIEE
jgi:hypothetical protein